MTKAKHSVDDVELMSKKVCYQGFFQVDELTFKHKLFAGGWSAVVKREVLERGHAVVVLAYDPRLDEVVLVEQIRIPVLAASSSPWLLELVAGMIDTDESSIEVAKRELMEEAGLEARRIEKIQHFFPSPGGCTERVDLYFAEVDATKACGLHGLKDEQEDIRVHVLSRINAYNKVVSGDIVSAPTIIGLQWLMMHYQDLLKRSS
ncbi:ADP-ribose diphosphatase [Shewanella surugensis]|uniref:ADP-ribose pyrophosphatase n=1 Tax=Shewanella surugensis TaxID=212020 RepID=A0ABT0LGY7_9GAMM|nr:ADP-ribose diphosphatase [Shewanella surugensis]MCL1126426.1 ADP-ribose diphosphatase [Shewanella surugensis]